MYKNSIFLSEMSFSEFQKNTNVIEFFEERKYFFQPSVTEQEKITNFYYVYCYYLTVFGRHQKDILTSLKKNRIIPYEKFDDVLATYDSLLDSIQTNIHFELIECFINDKIIDDYTNIMVKPEEDLVDTDHAEFKLYFCKIINSLIIDTDKLTKMLLMCYKKG